VRFVTFEQAAEYIRGKTVTIVGSAPSVLDNRHGFVDSHEVVVRVNNHKTGPAAGLRTDVHYSFYGTSIRKTAAELQAEGVQLCLCKCPDGKPIESAWHEANRRLAGIDFHYIYALRKTWWFCDTYVPSAAAFLQKMRLLGNHVPTTGFAAVLDVLEMGPASVYLTGFDFFSSGLHNINERWRPGDPNDPIGHRPELEATWMLNNAHRLTFDARLATLIDVRRAAA